MEGGIEEEKGREKDKFRWDQEKVDSRVPTKEVTTAVNSSTAHYFHLTRNYICVL